MGEFASFALVPEQGIVPEMAQLDGEMQHIHDQMLSWVNAIEE